jgi:hypothetical protein
MALDVEWSEMRARSWCETVTCRRLRSVVRQRRELSWHTSEQWDGRVFVVEFHVGGHERAGGGMSVPSCGACVTSLSAGCARYLGCVQVDERAGPWGPMLRHGFDMYERVNARNVSETRPHTATWTDAHSLALHSTVRRAMPMGRRNSVRQLQTAHAHVCGTIYQKQYGLAPPQMSQEHVQTREDDARVSSRNLPSRSSRLPSRTFFRVPHWVALKACCKHLAGGTAHHADSSSRPPAALAGHA